MRNEVVACKYPNHLISDIWLNKVLETHKTCVGFALAKDGIILHNNFDPAEVPLLEAIKKTQEKFKTEHVFFQFARADDPEKEYDLDSFQPFPILKKGDDTILAVMLEGDFPTYAKEGKNTPAYHFFKDYLEPKVIEMYGDLGNLDKLCMRMDGGPFRNDLKPHFEPRGYMLVLPSRGKSFAVSNNKLGGAYTWGLTSQSLGIPSDLHDVKVPEVKTVDVVATSKPLSFKERKAREAIAKASSAAASGPEPVTKEVVPISPPPAEKKEPVVPKETTPFHEVNGVLWIKPPIGSSFKEAKNFWNRHTSMPRPNTENPRALYAGFPVTELAADSPFFKFLAEKDRPQNAATSAFKAAHEQAEVKKAIQAKAKAEADEIPGLLTMNEKKEVIEDKKNDKLWGKTPEELDAFIKKTEMFSTQTQIPFEDLLHSGMAFLMRRNKRQLILICHEMRLRLIHELRSKGTGETVVDKKEDKQPELPLTADKKPMSFKDRKKAEAAAKAA